MNKFRSQPVLTCLRVTLLATLFVQSAPDLGGAPAKLLHMQPVFIDPQGNRTIGNSSIMVILNHLY